MVSGEDVAGVVITVVESVKKGFDLLHYGVHSNDVVHVFLTKVYNMRGSAESAAAYLGVWPVRMARRIQA